MTTPPSNAYLKTRVLTADPAELRMMLIEGAIKFAEQGKAGLVSGDYEQAYNGISQCQSIIMELINSLVPEQNPELCQRLSGLYTFLYTRLMLANGEKDVAKVDEVLELLRFEHETWQMLIDKLTKENIAATCLTDTPEALPPTVKSEAASTTNLVGGNISVEG